MLVTAVCSQMTPTIITLQPGQSYSVNHDAEILPLATMNPCFRTSKYTHRNAYSKRTSALVGTGRRRILGGEVE